jgi:acetyl-CoA C-acetyltransferase
MPDPIVIVSAARTPIGDFCGALAGLTAPQLGTVAIRAAVERARLDPALVDQVFMGCVLPAGLGQAPARQAALGAGLPQSAACTTINKVCGSGMAAVMLAHDLLLAGSAVVAVAGGMESMSNAPHLLPGARAGYRLGHQTVLDHLLLDGLEDGCGEATRGCSMGSFAEDCARQYGFSRAAQDAFAIESLARARRAIAEQAFVWESVPLAAAGKPGAPVIEHDEHPFRVQPEKVAALKPAFRDDGTVTPANSSAISDGAAALVLMRNATATRLGMRPLARIVAHTVHAQAPGWFTTAPVGAIRKLLDKAGWRSGEVDLWEINEAFAVVTMAAMQELQLLHERVNVHGGACALGHPIGASGARILVTLLGALRRRGYRRGIASLCIGGGEATAVAVEMLGVGAAA